MTIAATIEIVFFDVDGTLLDHDPAVRAGVEVFWAEHRELFGGSREQFLERWQALAEKHVRRYFDGELTWRGQRLARMKEMFGEAGVSLTDAEAYRHFTVYLRAYEEAWSLYDDVLPCLDALAALPGMRLGVVSNGDPSQQRRKLDRAGLSDRLRPVVISGDIGISKPDARIFAEACRLANLPPRRSAYVGDLLETDAIAARDAGLLGIWLDRAAEPADPPPNVRTIRSLTELPALLEPRRGKA